MEAENDSQSGHLDLLFEHRNKEYGAYALRKAYNRQLIKGCVGMCLVVVLCMGGFNRGIAVPLMVPDSIADNVYAESEDLPVVRIREEIPGIIRCPIPLEPLPEGIGTDAASKDSVEHDLFLSSCIETSPE